MPIELNPDTGEPVELDDEGMPLGTVQPTTQQPKPGLLSRIWSSVNTPVADIRGGPIRQWTDEFAEKNPVVGKPLNFVADVISSLSSPLNLVTGATGLGTKAAISLGKPLLAKGLNTATKALSVPVAAEGAYTIGTADSPVDVVSGGLELAGGLAGLKSRVPSIGDDLVNTVPEPVINKPIPTESFDPAKLLDEYKNKELEKIENRPPKMKVKAIGNTILDPETGEIISTGNKPLTPETNVRPMFTPKGRPGMSGSMQPTVPPDKVPQELIKTNEVAKVTPEGPAKESLYAKIRDNQRALLTSFDVSAPGRQGLSMILNKEFWTSLDDMFRAWGSDRAFNTVMDSINSHPNFIPGPNGKSLADEAGLKLSNLSDAKEEVFRGKLAEKYIPGIKASERAYVAFLDKLRSDSFNRLANTYKAAGVDFKTDLVAAKNAANFINNATGRGSLKFGDKINLENQSELLSNAFFAPRLMSSRIKMWNTMLNPNSYIKADPIMRKEALKSLFGVAGTGLLVNGLVKLAGGDVSLDPTSSDFWKGKINNTRIDPSGGFQQYLVAATRLLSGQSTSSVSGKTTDLTAGKFGQQNRADVAENFFTNKLAPIPSFVYAWMRGKEFDGQPFEVKRALLQRTVPIIMQDLTEIAQEDPTLLPMGVLPMVGVGMQSYGR